MDYSKGRFEPPEKRAAIPKINEIENAQKKHLTPAERAAEKGFDGIGTTENGGPDFKDTSYLYPVGEGQKNIVVIVMTGSRDGDFKAANLEAGFPDAGAKSPDSDYTWHHVDDYDPVTGKCTLQLVKRKAHEATKPHKGSCGQYDDHHGEKIYNPPKKKNPLKQKNESGG
ncbi:MAG: HNH endonuclease [Clostridia bacterium]|nr:HNH endonuclease [Clostridia bacterium]